MINWKLCGRKRPWPNLRHYPGICLDGPRKTTKTSLMIAGIRADIWTWDLPKTRHVFTSQPWRSLTAVVNFCSVKADVKSQLCLDTLQATDWTIEVWYSAETGDFSSNLRVQTGSGAHPASCTMGTGGSFRGGKARPRRDADHSHHLLPRSWMSRSYTSSPPCASIGVLWDCFTCLDTRPCWGTSGHTEENWRFPDPGTSFRDGSSSRHSRAAVCTSGLVLGWLRCRMCLGLITNTNLSSRKSNPERRQSLYRLSPPGCINNLTYNFS
jgi:hypothetical protein